MEVTDAGGFAKSQERLLLCPPKVLGYVLHQKIWCQFRIKDIKVASNDSHASLFDEQLELDDRYKSLLKVCGRPFCSCPPASSNATVAGLYSESSKYTYEKIDKSREHAAYRLHREQGKWLGNSFTW